MIVALPDDKTGNLYHVVNLLNQTVHAYRDRQAAVRSLEGDQRIWVQHPDGSWSKD
jgi:hypothetical protein